MQVIVLGGSSGLQIEAKIIPIRSVCSGRRANNAGDRQPVFLIESSACQALKELN